MLHNNSLSDAIFDLIDESFLQIISKYTNNMVISKKYYIVIISKKKNT